MLKQDVAISEINLTLEGMLVRHYYGRGSLGVYHL